MASAKPDYRRVVIEACRPTADDGAFEAKATVGVPVELSADIFSHGHDTLAAWVRWGPPRRLNAASDSSRLPRGWTEAVLAPRVNDRYAHWITPATHGALHFEVVATVDDFASWLHDIKANAAGGRDVTQDMEMGARLLEARLRRRTLAARDRTSLTAVIAAMRNTKRSLTGRILALEDEKTRHLTLRTLDRTEATLAGPYTLWVDGTLGGVSAWYEMFPRSEGAKPPKSGTFATAQKRLPAIAAMGFDIVYLPPIHPIGTTDRKGANNTPVAKPTDVGSPWAIGSPAGGHTAIDPSLGSLNDFDVFVTAARRVGLDVAIDFALQCSPDHPWVHDHPDWFAKRPDGTIQHAQNPPKQYQDVYPLDFECKDRANLWAACRDVFLLWCERGIRIFRVDNPHTKPLRFWQWLISEVRATYPDVVLLSEAFTRPKVMHYLAKIGFTQSYTYFTWRNAKWELSEYFTELSTPPSVDHFRPNFWPNTPDILHATLQSGGPPAFRLRLVLAALGATCWGMYSGYELYENLPVRPGSEEYLHSEKYELKPRNWDRADSLAPMITQINGIRRRHIAAIAQLSTLRLHHIDNDQLFCFSRSSADSSDHLLVIVNLDPFHAQEGFTWLDLPALGVDEASQFEAHDELTDTTYVWNGARNYVRLDPAIAPAHILHLRAR